MKVYKPCLIIKPFKNAMAAGAWRMERGGSLIFLLHQGSPQALVVTSAMVGVDRHCLLILCHPVSWFRALVIRISESWKLCIWIRVIQSNVSLKNLHKSETNYLNLESVCVCVCVCWGGGQYVRAQFVSVPDQVSPYWHTLAALPCSS